MPGLTLVIVCLFCSKAVVLDWGQFYLQGNIWQSLETLCYTRAGAAFIQWIEAKAAAQHPTLIRTASHSKELPGSNCQGCWGWETLMWECFLGLSCGLCVSFSSFFFSLKKQKHFNKLKGTNCIHNKLPLKENPSSTLSAKGKGKKKPKWPHGTNYPPTILASEDSFLG